MFPSSVPYIVDPLTGELVGFFTEPRYSQINVYNIDRATYAGVDRNAAAAFKNLYDNWAIGFIGQAEHMRVTDIPTVLAAYRTPPQAPASHVVTLKPDYSVTITDGPPVVPQPAIPDPAHWYVDRDPQTLEARLSPSNVASKVIDAPIGSGAANQPLQPAPAVSSDVAALMAMVQQLLAALAAKNAPVTT